MSWLIAQSLLLHPQHSSQSISCRIQIDVSLGPPTLLPEIQALLVYDLFLALYYV
jgi:hypothetical protein